ncbi:hypothetical protein FRB99_001768 [Tulasnella sp. 403]|nr:hypothetical protein FRB99_001768 [Tulasnella sp. 403]
MPPLIPFFLLCLLPFVASQGPKACADVNPGYVAVYDPPINACFCLQAGTPFPGSQGCPTDPHGRPGWYVYRDGSCQVDASQVPQRKARRSQLALQESARARIASALSLGIPQSGVSDSALCEKGMVACPIGKVNGVHEFECVDPNSVTTCGGCVAERGVGVDCTKLEGVSSVSCQARSCAVHSCRSRYKLTDNPLGYGQFCSRRLWD